jgi:hypothetical protein
MSGVGESGQQPFNVGQICSKRTVGRKPGPKAKDLVKLSSEMLEGLTSLLQNQTAANIFHTLSLPKETTDAMTLLPGDGKSSFRLRRV